MSEPIVVDDQHPSLFSQNKIVTLVSLKLKVVTSICGCVGKCCVIWRKISNADRLPRFIRGGTETTRVYHFWPGKNVFFCRGRLICGPDPRGFLLTAFSITLSSWIFCAYIANDSTLEHSSFITVFAVLLTVSVLINLVTVSTIDPGIIPRNASLASLNDAQLRRIKSRKLVINGIEVRLKFCRICRIYRPPRSSHCTICDNCVEKFDHHCPWIGQCIGLRNYRFYLMFTTSALIFFIYIFAFSCRKINRRILETRLWFFRTISSCPEAFALASFCFVAVWFVCGIVCFHVYLVMKNQTAYENLRRRHVDSPNPFNKGILRNIKEVCFVRLPSSRVDFRAEATSQMCHGGADQLQL
ncbi:hypothetical protein MKW98_015633 [Papaver atlanticum]|uniref:S-acyltransferase n=1 Tax=Papaver atlanticum TaxID=357466 RepID=A0AAD4S4Y6_9MAGN|nr:hypothetical protein MKW98_015633 [Papaver atlanticum]